MRTTRKAHQCRSLPVQIGLFHCAYCVHVLVNLENRQTRIKLMFAYLKHSLLVGVRRCLDCLGLSLHPFKTELVNIVTLTRLHKSAGSPEPSLFTFVISTSPYGLIMLGSSD